MREIPAQPQLELPSFFAFRWFSFFFFFFSLRVSDLSHLAAKRSREREPR